MNEKIYFTIINDEPKGLESNLLRSYFGNDYDKIVKKYFLVTRNFLPEFYDICHVYNRHEKCDLFSAVLPTDDEDLVVISSKINNLILVNKIIIKEKFLLSDIETYHQFGLQFPLPVVCIKRKYNEILKYLFISGLDIHHENDNILCLAAKYNNMEIAKFLIENGANINAQDGRPLLESCRKENLEMVKYLLIIGADIHANDEAALKESSFMGYFGIAKFLIENGANINKCGEIIYSCAFNGNLNTIKFLVETGINMKKYYYRCLITSTRRGYYGIIKYLGDLGFNAHVHPTILCDACMYGHIDIVKYLVENGANIHANNEGPLYSAAIYGYLDIIKYLILNGANVHAEQDIILYHTIKRGCFDVVKFLLENIDGFDKTRGTEILSDTDPKLINLLDEHAIKYEIEKN